MKTANTINPLGRRSANAAIPRGDEVQSRLIRNPYNMDPERALEYENGYEWGQSLGHMALMSASDADIERWYRNSREWIEGLADAAAHVGVGTLRDRILARLDTSLEEKMSHYVPMETKEAFRLRGAGEALGGLAGMGLGAYMGGSLGGLGGEALGDLAGAGVEAGYENVADAAESIYAPYAGPDRLAGETIRGALGSAGKYPGMVAGGALGGAAGGLAGYSIGGNLGGAIQGPVPNPRIRKHASLTTDPERIDMQHSHNSLPYEVDPRHLWATEKVASRLGNIARQVGRGGLYGAGLGAAGMVGAHAAGLPVGEVAGEMLGGIPEAAMSGLGGVDPSIATEQPMQGWSPSQVDLSGGPIEAAVPDQGAMAAIPQFDTAADPDLAPLAFPEAAMGGGGTTPASAGVMPPQAQQLMHGYVGHADQAADATFGGAEEQAQLINDMLQRGEINPEQADSAQPWLDDLVERGRQAQDHANEQWSMAQDMADRPRFAPLGGR